MVSAAPDDLVTLSPADLSRASGDLTLVPVHDSMSCTLSSHYARFLFQSLVAESRGCRPRLPVLSALMQEMVMTSPASHAIVPSVGASLIFKTCFVHILISQPQPIPIGSDGDNQFVVLLLCPNTSSPPLSAQVTPPS